MAMAEISGWELIAVVVTEAEEGLPLVARSKTRVKVVGGSFALFKPIHPCAKGGTVGCLRVKVSERVLQVGDCLVGRVVRGMVMAIVQKTLELLFDLSACCVSFLCGLVGHVLGCGDCAKFKEVPCNRC